MFDCNLKSFFTLVFRLSIVDTYYDKDKKCSRQKTIESPGWLDELEKHYDDPIAYFTKRVQLLKAQKNALQAPIDFSTMIRTLVDIKKILTDTKK